LSCISFVFILFLRVLLLFVSTSQAIGCEDNVPNGLDSFL